MYVSSTCFILFVKQKTAYEMRISDWSSDVCSSDLGAEIGRLHAGQLVDGVAQRVRLGLVQASAGQHLDRADQVLDRIGQRAGGRSEEHTSELQSLMRISYASFCLKNKIRVLRLADSSPHIHTDFNLSRTPRV